MEKGSISGKTSFLKDIIAAQHVDLKRILVPITLFHAILMMNFSMM